MTIKSMRNNKDKSLSQEMIHITTIQTPLGEMFAASTARGICLLCFYDKTYIDTQLKSLKERFNAQVLVQNNDHFTQLRQELDEYFLGKRTCFSVAIQLLGTPFQIQCYKALLTIPYAHTIFYKEEAQKINNPKAYRAVANANGKNMIEIIVPCHRVIGADGRLGGYSSGVDKKIFLLNLEKDTLSKNS